MSWPKWRGRETSTNAGKFSETLLLHLWQACRAHVFFLSVCYALPWRSEQGCKAAADQLSPTQAESAESLSIHHLQPDPASTSCLTTEAGAAAWNTSKKLTRHELNIKKNEGQSLIETCEDRYVAQMLHFKVLDSPMGGLVYRNIRENPTWNGTQMYCRFSSCETEPVSQDERWWCHLKTNPGGDPEGPLIETNPLMH